MAQTDCTLHKLPFEIRNAIFCMVLQAWHDEAPNHKSRTQLRGGFGGGARNIFVACTLERAMIPDRNLYREVFSLRVNMARIRIQTGVRDSWIRRRSPLALSSIRTVILTVSPPKRKYLPRELSLRETADYYLDKATSVMSKDLVLARNVQKVVIELSERVLQRDTVYIKWEMMEVLRSAFVAEGKKGSVSGYQNFASLQILGLAVPRKFNITSVLDFLDKKLGNVLIATREDGPAGASKWTVATWEAKMGERLTWVDACLE